MKFRVPTGVTQISHGGDVYRAKGGVVECPSAVGEAAGLTSLGAEEAPATTDQGKGKKGKPEGTPAPPATDEGKAKDDGKK